jgi:hypothetical protein
LTHVLDDEAGPAPPSRGVRPRANLARTSPQNALLPGGAVSAEPDFSAQALQRTVRNLAEALRDSGCGSPELSNVLTAVMAAEEHVLGEESELALLDARLAELLESAPAGAPVPESAALERRRSLHTDARAGWNREVESKLKLLLPLVLAARANADAPGLMDLYRRLYALLDGPAR